MGAKAFGAAGALAATTGSFLVPGIAQAATTDEWNTVAACESTNDWSINTGNGFFGGLQFTQSTWDAFGGRAFATRADLATKDEQIQIAQRVLASQGKGAWPVCGKGLTNGSDAITDVSTVGSNVAKPSSPTVLQVPKQQRAQPAQSQQNNTRSYTVVTGDNLFNIAGRIRVPLNTLINLNPQIKDPAMIFAGDLVHLPASAPNPAPIQSTQQTQPKHAAVVSTTQTTQVAASDVHTNVVSIAKSFLGDPYLYGGNSSAGLDCSALVQQSYKRLGIVLPRTANAQMNASRTITRAQLQPGDLAFATDSSGHAYHVAIYIGNGQVIEAPKPGSSVSIRPLYSSLNHFGRVIS